MNWTNPIAILLAAYLVVFVEVSFDGFRQLLGTQIDFLPALMVYASLSAGVTMIAALALLGGLWFDAFSGNRLGISILPLLVVGLLIYRKRELILRKEYVAQVFLGLVASALAPVMTLLSLWGIGENPVIGWGSFWQWLMMAGAGAAFTPVCFTAFNWFNRAFNYEPRPEISFRLDREIKRGRR